MAIKRELLLATVTLPQSNSTNMVKHTQKTSSSQTAEVQIEGAAGLDDMIQQGGAANHAVGNRGRISGDARAIFECGGDRWSAGGRA